MTKATPLLRSPVVLADFENAILNGMLMRQPHNLSRLPAITVSKVALDFGFAHLGKFAEYYRGRFGETPSETLASLLKEGLEV